MAASVEEGRIARTTNFEFLPSAPPRLPGRARNNTMSAKPGAVRLMWISSCTEGPTWHDTAPARGTGDSVDSVRRARPSQRESSARPGRLAGGLARLRNVSVDRHPGPDVWETSVRAMRGE